MFPTRGPQPCCHCDTHCTAPCALERHDHDARLSLSSARLTSRAHACCMRESSPHSHTSLRFLSCQRTHVNPSAFEACRCVVAPSSCFFLLTGFFMSPYYGIFVASYTSRLLTSCVPPPDTCWRGRVIRQLDTRFDAPHPTSPRHDSCQTLPTSVYSWPLVVSDSLFMPPLLLLHAAALLSLSPPRFL